MQNVTAVLGWWKRRQKYKSNGAEYKSSIISIKTGHAGFFPLNLFFPRHSWSWWTHQHSTCLSPLCELRPQTQSPVFKAVLNPYITHLVKVAMTQVQTCHLDLLNLMSSLGPLLSLSGLSDGIPCLGSTDCTTQLGVISNLLRVQAKHAANICWATFLKHCPDSTAEAETPSHIHQLNTSSLPPSIFPSPKDYLWALHPKDKDQLPWCTISGYMRVFFSLSRETST